MKLRAVITIGAVLSVLGTASFHCTPASASVSDDQVTSQKLREADGTSAQNTNSGSGVKTGHIQNLAVTNAKIADGAVTDAKITGPISASKISSTGLNADTLDGNHASAFAPAAHAHEGAYEKKKSKVITVALDGSGDYLSPVEAVASITDAGPANPYLVLIMPGVFEIGPDSIQMKEFVDIQGSGRNISVISGDATDGTNPLPAVVLGANNAELRSLTIRNSSQTPNSSCMGMYNDSAAPLITDVTIELADPTLTVNIDGINTYNASPILEGVVIRSLGGAVSRGIINQVSSAVLHHVTISISGPSVESIGIQNLNGSPVISESTITVNDGSNRSLGIYNIQNSWPSLTETTVKATSSNGKALYVYYAAGGGKVDRCTVEGGAYAVYSEIQGSGFLIGGSKLTGAAGGRINSICVNSYDGVYYAPLSANCTP